MNIEHCRSCNAEVVWLKTSTGRSMPVNADTVEETDEMYKPATKHVSHFATCPQSNQWRKKR